MLSFQTTLIISAKINKMCCPTKENTCFSCWIDFSFAILMV
ncbi:hypothetical protein HMPREF0971_03265 [Segatella oris F0302]|uniref:Uncharacterized protein n=1 Tax=Segatella oris F0302 TaxID=649760 RepID=D1QW70_9BACT|nr:hypothetical protein HMPREF0971_03265 [Segatella oris F0302]